MRQASDSIDCLVRGGSNTMSEAANIAVAESAAGPGRCEDRPLVASARRTRTGELSPAFLWVDEQWPPGQWTELIFDTVTHFCHRALVPIAASALLKK